MGGFFRAYHHLYPTVALQFDAIRGKFPSGSAAQTWFDGGEGRVRFTTFAEFKAGFLKRFGANQADRAKYDYDFLHVKQGRHESVGVYYTRYSQLLAEMKAIDKPVEGHWQVTKFVDGLLPALSKEVHRILRRAPNISLVDVVSEAEMEEKANPLSKPATVPQLNGINSQKGKKPKKPRYRCFYCRNDDHSHQRCPKIAARRAAGTWEDRPRNGAGPGS